MSRDMGPVSRCLGKDVPPARSWQDPLPASFDRNRNGGSLPPALFRELWASALSDEGALALASANIAAPDVEGLGRMTYVAQFIELAYRCAATFRRTDYFGGCNGARIRFAPQSEWPVNSGLDKVECFHSEPTQYFLVSIL